MRLPAPLALLVTLLVVVDPILLKQSTLVMTETLATFLATLAWYFWFRWWQAIHAAENAASASSLPNWGWGCLLGFALGLNSLCRPTSQLWTAGLLLTTLLFLPRTSRLISSGWLGACVLAILPVAGWAWRNQQQLGVPIWMTTHGGYTLYLANNPWLYQHFRDHGGSRQWSFSDFQADWQTQMQHDAKNLSPVAKELADDRLANRQAWQTIRSQPATFAMSCLYRIGWLWAWWPATETSDPQSPRYPFQQIAIGTWYAFLELLALIGTISLIRNHPPREDAASVLPSLVLPPFRHLLPIWTLVLSLTLVHAVYWSNMRMRAPIMPMLCLLAGIGLLQLAKGRWPRRGHRGLASLALVAAIGFSLICFPVSTLAQDAEATTGQEDPVLPKLEWSLETPLPFDLGVAGPFAGWIGDQLVVAGGANFPEGFPWEGGVKAWHDDVWLLHPKQERWIPVGKLPRRLAYGLSFTTDQGLICVGGSDADRHYEEVFRLSIANDQLVIQRFPPLPTPLANACGAMLNDTLYIAGGLESPLDSQASSVFLRLDLQQTEWKWETLPTWPGPPRMLSVASANDDAFFLFSGAELIKNPEGKIQRRYLQDAYAYAPISGWRKLADAPYPTVAAPSPAPCVQTDLFAILGGDDGSSVGMTPLTEHPGFRKQILFYSVERNTWQTAGELPAPRVTVPTVWRRNAQGTAEWWLPSGEERPGVRSPQLWRMSLTQP